MTRRCRTRREGDLAPRTRDAPRRRCRGPADPARRGRVRHSWATKRPRPAQRSEDPRARRHDLVGVELLLPRRELWVRTAVVRGPVGLGEGDGVLDVVRTSKSGDVLAPPVVPLEALKPTMTLAVAAVRKRRRETSRPIEVPISTPLFLSCLTARSPKPGTAVGGRLPRGFSERPDGSGRRVDLRAWHRRNSPDCARLLHERRTTHTCSTTPPIGLALRHA